MSMITRLTPEILATLQSTLPADLCGGKAWEWLAEQGLDFNKTIVPRDLWMPAINWVSGLWNTADWGRGGKTAEAMLRLYWRKATTCHWGDLFPRSQGKTDLYWEGRPVECKSGGGTWLTYHGVLPSPEALVNNFAARTSLLVVFNPANDVFVLARWCDWMDWLAEFPRAKGDPLYWFRTDTFKVSSKGTTTMSIQNWLNPKAPAKTRWIAENPYNLLG